MKVFDMKVGDRVSCCSVIGKPPTSFGHTIRHIQGVLAWISGRASCVALEFLVPEDPKPIAHWRLELNIECPKCEKYVNLLDGADFWDGRDPNMICETNTPRTRNMEVICPECGHEFEVDTEY